MRGRKPKPTQQRILEGNAGGRPLNADEPALPDLVADRFDQVPVELQGDLVASAEWARLAPMLRKAKAITEGERGGLIALCQQWSRYLEANGKIKESGLVITAPSGYPMVNPYVPIANKALGNCSRLWVELGLTPTSRTRVTTTPHAPGAVDPFAEFDNPPPVSH